LNDLNRCTPDLRACKSPKGYNSRSPMIGDRQKSDHKRKLAEGGFLVTSHLCFQRRNKICERLLPRSGQGRDVGRGICLIK